MDRIVRILMKSKTNAELQKKLDVVEELLNALGIEYDVPTRYQIGILAEEFKKLVDNPDVRVKIKPKYVEVQTYRSEGYGGDWWDSDVYSYFGFKYLVSYQRTHI